jgi:hypothetical protein
MGLFSNANSNQQSALFFLALMAVIIIIGNMVMNNRGHRMAMDELNRERISEGKRPYKY